MKLVDQYIQAVGSKLPLKGRADIKKELESLLREDIESKYGENPSEKEAMEAIRSFGSPQSVALRYAENQTAVSRGLTPLYLMLIKIVPGALAIAFAVITVVKALSGNGGGPAALLGFFASSVLTSSLAAVGAISIAFVLASRCVPDAGADPDEEWDPVELKGIEIDSGKESTAEHIIAIAGLSIAAVVLNAYPQAIRALETSFFATGLAAGRNHFVDIERLALYVSLFNPVWAAQAVRAVFAVSGKAKIRTLKIWGLIAEVATVAIHWAMAFDLSLYSDYAGIVGFRMIFILVALIETIELASHAFRSLVKKMENLGS